MFLKFVSSVWRICQGSHRFTGTKQPPGNVTTGITKRSCYCVNFHDDISGCENSCAFYYTGITREWKSGACGRKSIDKREDNVYNTGMREIPERIYVDSSVISGMFDSNDHPAKAQPFWDAVFDGKIRVVLSSVLDDEIKVAPDNVRKFYRSIPESQVERIIATSESNTLAGRYIKAGVLTQNHLTDCKHVALAAIADVDILVSWNTRHIVNDKRIRRFNDVGIGFGCDEIKILTPNNVIQQGE